jgi:sRNA-binding carbon storage regulator CsrA
LLVLHRKRSEKVALIWRDFLAWVEVTDVARNEAKILVETDEKKSEDWLRVNERLSFDVAPDVIVSLSLTDVHRGSVRLGFDAPEDVKIWRKELLDKPLSSPK